MAKCDGEVESIRGLHVLFTGKVIVEGEQITRPNLKKRAALMGAYYMAHEMGLIDVLVHGDLRSQIVKDPLRLRSQKIIYVEQLMRTTGRHIHIINGPGFGALIRGRSAPCLT